MKIMGSNNDSSNSEAGDEQVAASLSFLSRKEYSTPGSSWAHKDSEDFLLLGGAQWFDTQDQVVEVFVENFTVHGCFPEEIQLQQTWYCCQFNQCACEDGDIVRYRGEKLLDVYRELLEKFRQVLQFLRNEVCCRQSYIVRARRLPQLSSGSEFPRLHYMLPVFIWTSHFRALLRTVHLNHHLQYNVSYNDFLYFILF